MGSPGNRTLRINTQERAVSTDINRLQSFAQQDGNELLRYLLNVQTDEDDLSIYGEPATLTAPLTAEIINGLMVKPQVGSFNLLVDSGLLGAIVPSGLPDESNYKYIRDVGVSTPGALTIGANVSGNIRIDVIECRMNPVDAIVTDSRDIFNPTTGLFTAATVTKETQGRLEYRVRAGTPGSGYPGAATGWLPLAIASVPSGAASNNDVTFWDVRPLVGDRPGVMKRTARPLVETLDARAFRASGSSVILTGSFRARLNGRIVGGQIRSGVPGVDTASIDVANAVNQSSTYAEPLANDAYLYVCTPHGLPRWARYNDAPSARVPRNPKGILVVSTTKPDQYGRASASIVMPASTGLTSPCATTDTVCVAILPKDALGAWQMFHASKGIQHLADGPLGVSASLSGSAGAYKYIFSITDDLWPPNAKALHVVPLLGLTMSSNSSFVLRSTFKSYADGAGADSYMVEYPGEFGIVGATKLFTNGDSSPQFVPFEMPRIRLPLPAYSGSPTSPRRFEIDMTGSYDLYGGVATFNSSAALVRVGFEL